MNISIYTKEFKQNLNLALPVMLGQLGHVLVGFVDNVMIGRLGAAQLAAVSLGNTMIFFALLIGLGFSFAITPLVAEADGEGDIVKGRSFFQHGMVMCGVNGILLFLFLIVARPVLYYLDQPAEVVDLAIPYINIVAISMIPMMIFQGLKQFADGLSMTKYAMYATIAANVINVIFNYLLIYGIWFFPRLELEGAAIGTLLSRVFMMVMLYFILKNKSKLKPYFVLMKRSLKKETFKKLLSLGFPTALQMLFEGGIFTASVILAGTIGTNAQAANQIALNLVSMTFMVATGLGVTATIRVANQKGKKDYINLRRIANSIYLQTFLISAVFTVAFILLKSFLPTLYIDDQQVINLAAQLLVVAALFQLSDGLQVAFLGALRGMQDVKIPTIICFVAYWLIGFPISIYFGQEEYYGSAGIWFGLLAGLTVSAILLYIRFNNLTHPKKEKLKKAYETT
ncbi:MAG: MATE family efflux transporter [Psychroflexus halocasei]|uniref:MATE family efflux transporter n=1 Tax=Psychroflexus sp. S27 TaxID=1982757 RepID=UPI000C2B255E|nr:MATE family efflux transporter [Psychroflexus sp. S27]PJX24062.1 MATE family efflux transporter [Psychroflexus sp. S27]